MRCHLEIETKSKMRPKIKNKKIKIRSAGRFLAHSLTESILDLIAAVRTSNFLNSCTYTFTDTNQTLQVVATSLASQTHFRRSGSGLRDYIGSYLLEIKRSHKPHPSRAQLHQLRIRYNKQRCRRVHLHFLAAIRYYVLSQEVSQVSNVLLVTFSPSFQTMEGLVKP